MSKTFGEKAGRVVRRKLADGTVKVYRYDAYIPKVVSRYGPDTLGAMIAAYRGSTTWRQLSASTQTNYGIYLRDLERMAALPLVGVRRRELLEVMEAIAAARGNGAATGFLRAASAVFSWGVDRGWIEHTPLSRIKALPGGHLTAWTPDQAKLAIAKLPETMRRVVVLALYTGQRRGDLAAMAWSAYDGLTLRLKQQKTGAALVIPVHPALKAELDAWKAQAQATVILTDEAGLPWPAQRLSERLPRALGKIGLPAGLNVHGLRKLAAANLAQAGCTVHEIAAITGHRSLSMVQLYTQSVDQTKLAEAAILRLQQKNTNRQKRR